MSSVQLNHYLKARKERNCMYIGPVIESSHRVVSINLSVSCLEKLWNENRCVLLILLKILSVTEFLIHDSLQRWDPTDLISINLVHWWGYTLVKIKFVNTGETSMAYPNPGTYKEMALRTCAEIRNVPTQIKFSPGH